jgi:hypothetical protein
MKPPLEVIHLTDQYLEVLRNEPQHSLTPAQCIHIYQEFGLSNHDKNSSFRFLETEKKDKLFKRSKADQVLGWLAILTAEKVLPIWQEKRISPEGEKREHLWGNPNLTLEIGKNLIYVKKPIQETLSYLNGLFYYPSPDKGGAKDGIIGYLASRAASDGLEVLLFGVSILIDTGALFYTDDERSFAPHDFAAMAVNAYAGFEEHELTQKRLEFWEWWLTEAIPQAWELAG